VKIALCARSFRPETGGLGSVTHSYALGLLERGWHPTVITHACAPEGYDQQFPYPVVRRPRFLAFRRLLRANDAVVFIHQSITYILWSCLIRRPIVSTIHGRIWAFPNLRIGVTSLFFECHLRLRPHAALISETVRSPATRAAPVIGNPYDHEIFHSSGAVPKTGTVVFSGRISRGKGVFRLLEAVQSLRREGLEVTATFAGTGPDECALRQAVQDAGLGEVVTFLGHCEPGRVAELLRSHQIAAVPSDWIESFGLVALEAIACGCYVVAFPDGGLPYAVGKAGLVTATKSSAALASGIRRVMTDVEFLQEIDSQRAAHLKGFSRASVVTKLINLIQCTAQPTDRDFLP
jgi:glycosyltransferase involved in cell wall biosynthesis